LSGSPQAAAYLSLIAMLALSFLFIYMLCKHNDITLIKSILFFLLFLGNAHSIGNFIRLGRVVSLFPFMLMIPFFMLILRYKERRFDRYALILIPLYALILISHFQEAILISTLPVGLFLLKSWKERLCIIAGIAAAFLLAGFWLFPFISASFNTSILTFKQSEMLWTSEKGALRIIPSIMVSLSLFVLFYLYWRQQKSMKDALFYLPLLLLNLLFLLRIYPQLPLLNYIHPDPFITLFIFFALFFLMKLNFSRFSRTFKIAIFSGLCLISILSILISIIHTPWFIEYTDMEKQTISMLKHINGTFTMYGDGGHTSYIPAYYSYAPIFLGLKTADGWYPHITAPSYYKLLHDTEKSINERKCEDFALNIKKLNVTNVFGFREICNSLEICGFKLKIKGGETCIYEF